MIGLSLAAYTEVVPALITANTIRGHVARGSLVDILPFIIFVVVIDIALHEFDSVSTFAADNPILLVKKFQSKFSLEVFIAFVTKNCANFNVQ